MKPTREKTMKQFGLDLIEELLEAEFTFKLGKKHIIYKVDYQEAKRRLKEFAPELKETSITSRLSQFLKSYLVLNESDYQTEGDDLSTETHYYNR